MQLPTSLLSLIFLLVSQPPIVSALPPIFENLLGAIEKRQCAVPCGYGNAYCCNAGSVCYTDAQTKAQCAASTAMPAGTVYTTTGTSTDLSPWTSTYTVYGAPAPTSYYIAQSTAICYAPTTACGAICCSSSQFCYVNGQCRDMDSSVIVVGGSTVTSYSAPLRPTTAMTNTAVITATVPFQTPAGTAGGTTGIVSDSNSSGLSPGAIAGIVIGVIVGLILLALILFFCLAGAGVRKMFGRKDRRIEETEVIEERYTSRRGSVRGSAAVAASRRETHTGWFGGARGGKTTTVIEKKSSKKKEGGILLGIAASLAALWVVLGFRKKQLEKRAPPPPPSDSGYLYSDSYVTSESSASSDRRTRTSRR